MPRGWPARGPWHPRSLAPYAASKKARRHSEPSIGGEAIDVAMAGHPSLTTGGVEIDLLEAVSILLSTGRREAFRRDAEKLLQLGGGTRRGMKTLPFKGLSLSTGLSTKIDELSHGQPRG